MLVHWTQWKTDRKTKPLAYNRSFLEDTVTIICFFARDDGVGQLLDTGVVPILISKTGNLGKDLPPDLGYRRSNPSHCYYPLLFIKTCVQTGGSFLLFPVLHTLDDIGHD